MHNWQTSGSGPLSLSSQIPLLRLRRAKPRCKNIRTYNILHCVGFYSVEGAIGSFRAIAALMHNPGTLSESPASSLLVPGRQCIRWDIVQSCFRNFSRMQRVQERAAWRGELCRPVLRTPLRAQARDGIHHSDAPEVLSGSHSQEQWLDHLLQAVEVLLVILLAAGQFPAARTVWQDLRKSTQFTDKETTTAEVYWDGATVQSCKTHK